MFVFRIAIAGCTALVTSCGYTSQYVAPRDSRARVVWGERGPTALMPAASAACQREVLGAMNAPRVEPEYALIDDPTVMIEDGVVLRFGHAGPDPRQHDVGRVVRAREAPAPARRKEAPPAATGQSGQEDKHDKQSERHDREESSSATWLAVAGLLAIVVTPLFTFALIASHPVQGTTASPAMDAVNAYNDLSRTSGSACSVGAAAAGAAP